MKTRVSHNNSGASKGYVDSAVRKESDARSQADIKIRQDYEEFVNEESRKLSVRIEQNETSIMAVSNNLETETQTRISENERIDSVVEANKQQCNSNFNTVNNTIEEKDRQSQIRIKAVSDKVDQKETECIARVQAETQARQQSEQRIYSYVDSKTAGALHYIGSVATVADLPKSGMIQGDMYNVKEDGQNYAWTGSEWDSQGPLINLKPLEQGIVQNATAIQNEVTNRQAADNNLQGNIDKEVTDRESAVSSLMTKITNEETRAIAEEAKLQSGITKEENDRKEAINLLRSDIDVEISKKTSAEIAQDFEQTKAKINAVADLTDTGGFWVFAVTDANGNVTFGQTINGDLINGI